MQKYTLLFVVLSLFFISTLQNAQGDERRGGRFSVITLKKGDDPLRLALKASDATAASYLDLMITELSTSLSNHTLQLLFERINKNQLPTSYIYKEGKGILKGYLRTPILNLIGSSWDPMPDLSVTSFPRDLPPLKLRDISTATKGICGPIAILHSLVRLGLKTADDIADGNFLDQQQLSQVLRYQKDLSGIKIPDYKQAHLDAGATACEESKMINAGSTAKLSKFNEELSEKMTSTDPLWDCGLIVKSVSVTSKVTMNHIEHVTGVVTSKTRRGHTEATITTVNGLDQGDKGSSIPANPGFNTWKSTPKGEPDVTFDKSTSSYSKLYKAGLPTSVTHVQWVCCRK